MEKAPTDYSKSKIYTIRSHQTDKYYIGSTTQSLSKRFSKHHETYASYLKGKGGKTSSYDLLALGDAYIELLEEFPCENKEQLHKREGELIRQHKAHVVNIAIPGRDKATWHQDNKEERLKKASEYYEQNKDDINAKRRHEREVNGDVIRAQQREYYAQHKKEIQAKNSVKHQCECGGRYQKCNRLQHMKTTKHLEYVKNKV